MAKKIIEKKKQWLETAVLATMGVIYVMVAISFSHFLGIEALPFKLFFWLWVGVVAFFFGRKFFFLLKADEVGFITNNLSGKIFLKDKPGWKILIPVLERLDKISLKLEGPGEEEPVFVSVPTLRSEVKIIAIYSYRVSRATPEITFNYILAGGRVEEEMKSVLGGYFSILVSRLKIEEVITQYKPQLIKLVEALMTEGRLDSVGLEAEFLLEEATRIAGEIKILEHKKKKGKIGEDAYEMEKRELEKRMIDVHSLFDILLKDFSEYLKGGLEEKRNNSNGEFVEEVKEKIDFLQKIHQEIEEKERTISSSHGREEKGLAFLSSLRKELGKKKFFSKKFIKERSLSPYERERGIDLNFYIKDLRPSDEIETARDDQARVEYQLEREVRRRNFILQTMESLMEKGISPQAASDMALIQLGAQEGKINRIYFPDIEQSKGLVKAASLLASSLKPKEEKEEKGE